MTRALEGLCVVDFSHVVAGPLATHFLALNGARVIKIEPPKGDPLRDYTSDPSEQGMAPAFKGINVGKESVVLDLKSEEGRQEALRLVSEADVVVENFRPGVMARLGLDYQTLSALNDRLIYCSVSGFGQSGAMSDVAAIDQIVQAISGMMYMGGHEGQPAMRIGFPVVDTFTGLLAAFAIQTALLQRERGFVSSQYIDVAMLDASLKMMLSVVNPLLLTGEKPVRTGNRGFSKAPTADNFACKQGEICTGAVQQGHVEKMLGVLGLSHLLELPDYADRLARIQNSDAMRSRLAAAFLTETADHWEHRLQSAGVPAAKVRSVDEAIKLDHLAERDLFLNVDGETVLNAGFLFREGGPGTDRGAPPLPVQTLKKEDNQTMRKQA